MNKKLQQLTEIKVGETGYGLLIEHDGHILPKQDIVEQIKEDINNGDKFVIPDNFIVSAVFQKYGVKNANGRIYPEKTLKREVQKYLENQVANHCAIGSLDHPENQSALSGHDVSHNILDLRWNGKTLVGEMKLHLSPGFKKYGICSTSGDLAANMILDGIQIGVSSRALGSLENKFGSLIVSDDLTIIGWDIVIENSTPGAKIARNMEDLQQYMEGKNYEGELLSEKLNKVKQILG